MKKKITFISDTHTKHKHLTNDLPGGDILIHCGDISSRGYINEIKNFLEWFDGIKGYEYKIFIAGNHDFGFQDNPKECIELLKNYPSITYLEDNSIIIDGIKIYGSPWQPRFHNWAFNVNRGWDIAQKWEKIPQDTDILITHGPLSTILDQFASSIFLFSSATCLIIRFNTNSCQVFLNGASGTPIDLL